MQATPANAAERANFSCRLCDGESLALYYVLGNDGRFKHYKCEHCGLVNLDLATGLDQTQFTPEFRDPSDETNHWNRAITASFEFLQANLPDARSLCDIGCGSGRLLYVAQRAGWRVFGLELSEMIATATAKRLGIEVIAANFLEFTPAPEHAKAYDAVCLRHVLEHLPDSKLAMTKINALLRPGGHALLEMPNIEGLDKRVKRFIVNASLHRRTYSDNFVAGHCNEFCKASFQYLLRETGFRLVTWETYSHKRANNVLLNRVHIGNKARALVQKIV